LSRAFCASLSRFFGADLGKYITYLHKIPTKYQRKRNASHPFSIGNETCFDTKKTPGAGDPQLCVNASSPIARNTPQKNHILDIRSPSAPQKT
jgi:hypothetical protein